MSLSNYFGKRSPSPPRTTGKRKRFLFNNKGEDNDNQIEDQPPLKVPKKATINTTPKNVEGKTQVKTKKQTTMSELFGSPKKPESPKVNKSQGGVGNIEKINKFESQLQKAKQRNQEKNKEEPKKQTPKKEVEQKPKGKRGRPKTKKTEEEKPKKTNEDDVIMEDINEKEEKESNTTDRFSKFALTNNKLKSSPFKPKEDKDNDNQLVTKVANIKSSKNYTPLEKQVVKLWQENPGVVLAVEVGYRFILMGEDAVKVSKILNFILTPPKGNNHFAQCSIPSVTLHVHLHRLVTAGLKVALVTQTETRALKKASSNRNNPFARKISQIYTKGTFISPKIDPVTEDENSRKSGAADSGFLVCFLEDDKEEQSKRKQTTIAILAVNVCTGQIIWDNFEDEFLRSELENRLASLKPTEMIIPESKYLSTQTEKLIDQYYQENCLKDAIDDTNEITFQYNAVRIERVSVEENTIQNTLNSFYGKDSTKLENLPNLVRKCIGQMINYLKAFSLENLFSLTNNFSKFTNENILPLDKNVIDQLEILRNVDGNNDKNLFWLIDVTQTAFGSRLLRYWLLHPMNNSESINNRLQAVSELIDNHIICEKLNTLLHGLPDLERGICRLFYHKCEPLEFISIMRSFMNIFKNIIPLHNEINNIQSSIIKETILSIPDLFDLVSGWLNLLSFESARSGKFHDLFQLSHLSVDPYPKIAETKDKIEQTEDKLNKILAQIRSDTGLPRLKFITVATDEYLIELTIKQSENVIFFFFFVSFSLLFILF